MKLDYMSNEGKILEKKSQKINKILSSFLLYAFILFVITFMIWGFYHEAKVVSGESMQPTINSTYAKNSNNNFDIVLMNKNQNFKRQDIVIVDFSGYKDELIIKRVIATSGDSIKIVAENNKSVVYLKKANEDEWKKLNEDYVDNQNNNTNCSTTFSKRSENGYNWDKNSYTENNDNTYSNTKEVNINVSEKMFKEYYVKIDDEYILATSYVGNVYYYTKSGDTYALQHGITEDMFKEYYIKNNNTYQPATEYIEGRPYYIKNNDGSIKINDGYFFALGDNRANSLDSSEVGPLKNTRVKGVVETLIPDGTFLNKLLRKLLHLKLAN